MDGRLDLRSVARANPGAGSGFKRAGIVLGVAGIMAVMVTLVANIVTGNLVDDPNGAVTVGKGSAWAFGLTITGFGALKIGIALILMGILVTLWARVGVVKTALPSLMKAGDVGTPVVSGEFESPYGRATVAQDEPDELLIHRMARTLWLPMLAMGAMALLAGFVVSLVWSGRVAGDPLQAVHLSAVAQGLQFAGEGFLLSGVSFLLGTILGSLRKGGAEVQKHLGVPVNTLEMPLTGKLFVGLMAAGLMVEIGQLITYLAVATFDNPASISSYFAWLGPVRESGLGLLLSGIVLALATIAKVLGFQFHRLSEIVVHGS